MAYAGELKRIKKGLFAAAGQSDQQADDNSSEGKQKATESGNNQSMDAIIKRLVKCKDDNKKLKSILKYIQFLNSFRDQLEKSEVLRQETQLTVETLRQEFEHLA